ncbi:DUF1254 domain-containing protein [Flavobacterium sp. TR2]|uniref:DUF1254 domain-containing protein n=1 Tax=Flavobacterium sp. TR2 TaxID=2977321 RepID=UPI0021B090E0|nr:DUF1254 domain-containing protein [Flavobacterium sp. TR2]UWY27011.1 DUF1254 domain-containing protein [Flavobacterium sp. TR2]
MKNKIVIAVLLIALFVACKQNKTTETQTVSSNGSSKFDELANMSFEENRPTEEQAKTLADELLFQRACQTYLWALPLINTISMKEGSEKTFGAGYNVLPIWKKRLDANTLVTTPNSDVIYAMSYVDLGKDGPIVFEAPPMLQGILLDFWQRPIPVDGGKYFGDLGFFGPDAGKGGKFLILPPNYKGTVPSGYFVYRSQTNNLFIFLRSFYELPTELTPAVSLVEKSKIYPLGKESSALPMKFPDASGVKANMLPARDFSAFEQLKHLVDTEDSANLGSADWLGMLASLGIIKGQPFNPDQHTKDILDKAAKAAYRMSRVVGMSNKVSGRSFLMYPDRQWVNPMTGATRDNISGPFTKELDWKRKEGGYMDLDTRIWFFTDYYSWSPGMASQTPGKGAKYVVGFRDKEGKYLNPSTTYKVTLPANVPAANFWSLTLYEAENASGYANGQPFPSLGSKDKPVQNADGSTDLYVGPKAPEGKTKNWLKTVPGKGYFAILRLYGPTEKALDNSWVPGDFEKFE